MNEHILMRITTGEEVIATMVMTNDKGVVIVNPRILNIQYMQNGQAGATLMPMFLMGKDNAQYNIPWTSMIGYTFAINPEHVKYYLESISGIALPNGAGGLAVAK